MEIADSRSLTGYAVKVVHRGSFHVRGYTLVAPPGKRGEAQIPAFWDDVIRDGRLAALRGTSRERPWVLGLGSWDPECPPRGQRYTICVEETAETDFSAVESSCPLYRKAIGESDWLCFETRFGEEFPRRFWKDDPYRMMGTLGYRFKTAPEDYSIGLHFEAYPPGFSFGSGPNTAIEFWITVEKA